MRNWIIVGDAEGCGKMQECLIRVCYSKENAEQELIRMLEKPTEFEKEKMATHRNVRVKYAGAEQQWWDNPALAN